ncbi:hypothetical protein KLP40_09385 [Hymenobacter sp. NST-14]|uniref:hypothetical protein n=1 Tax=Hymenobacter piscis TaxID=2839984 RepID=UPI001C019087|nr:hypothetical protein [Hymenobacter piscis]MBT9393374.1 hypothetical protein [Hymenobacter piscis]
MKEILLLTVRESRPLTGLGVLLQPESEARVLALWPLHTALLVQLHYPGKQEISTIASVEEVARAGEPGLRSLLLTQENAPLPPIGTEVWWLGEEARWEDLL